MGSSDRNNHGHKKFGRLWEQIIFPYEKIKMAYSCWHITPIQIVAELRDPNKLKKPKRPADLPNGAYLYDNTSDEESDQRSRLMMDIKKEPMDMHDQNSFPGNVLPTSDDLTKDEMIESIIEHTRQKCEQLQNASTD